MASDCRYCKKHMTSDHCEYYDDEEYTEYYNNGRCPKYEEVEK